MTTDPHARALNAQLAHQLLAGEAGQPGVFEAALGLRPATTAIKVVHIMNDLAQQVVGGYPEHKGDLLCRVIRHDKSSPKEDNSDAALRADAAWGAAYGAAYPRKLGERKILQLREAAALLLNFDGGMYAPGDSMASGLATHWSLLGAEGFCRFRVGAYLAALLGDEGRMRLHALFTEEDQDPVSRALAPLRLDVAQIAAKEAPAPTLQPFDEALGRGLKVLMEQPLSKLLILRLLALAVSLGVALKIYGVGRAGGRPTLLALPAEEREAMRPLREAAVQSLNRAVDAMDKRFARDLFEADGWGALAAAPPGEDPLLVSAPHDAPAAAYQAIQALRGRAVGKGRDTVYWPEKFAEALGKKVGAIGPKRDQAGWGKHLTLTPDLVEALVLMFVPSGAAPRPWQDLWGQIREELGVVIGADEYLDGLALKEAGVLHVSRDELGRNSDLLLKQAIRRGIARQLPDSGAEAGGELL